MDETQARAAMTQMADLIARVDGAEDLRLGLPLRMTASSWLFEAAWRGDPVVVKRIPGPDAPGTIRAMRTELDRIARIFGDGDCQANRCLAAWPETGLIVLSHAPGARLSDCIAIAPPEERDRLLRHAGEWLRRLTAARQRDIGFGPRKWIQKLRGPGDLDLSPAQRGLLARLRHDLERQAPHLRGTSVRQAATHGDYVGINAHYHQGVIHGVDMAGESWLAVARDVARFLVWQTLHDPAPTPSRWCGLRAGDVSSFLSSGVLQDRETAAVLPFFIGIDLHRRMSEALDDAARPRARAAIAAYLSDPPAAGAAP